MEHYFPKTKYTRKFAEVRLGVIRPGPGFGSVSELVILAETQGIELSLRQSRRVPDIPPGICAAESVRSGRFKTGGLEKKDNGRCSLTVGSHSMPLPAGSLELTEIREWRDGSFSRLSDSLAAEEPLEIRIGSAPLIVTMRTPGHDRELTAGFLWTEGLIDSPNQIEEFRQLSKPNGTSENTIEVQLRADAPTREHLRGSLLATSSCGVCGKALIEAIRTRDVVPLSPGVSIDPEVLCQLPARIRVRQEVFGRTGGLHAAALFSEGGELLALREDIGRHNAVDKIVGWALLSRLLPLSNRILMVSGRGGFEIVQKALTAGIPMLASVSAPSSLAVKLAREFNLTLIGFLRDRRFVVYSSPERLTNRSRKQAESN